MKVSAYRELIDFVGYAIASVKSSATPAERARGMDIVRRRVAKLKSAECPRATTYDRERAARIIASAADIE